RFISIGALMLKPSASAIVLGASLLMLLGCKSEERAVPTSQADRARPEGTASAIRSSVFGKTADGQDVHLYTLSNARGMTVKVMDYGVTITELLAPDRN